MPEFSPSQLQIYFWEALAIILVACICVPLSRRLGLGQIIGYLLAGVVTGVMLSLSFEANPEELLQFAEFGVVLFLFVIGLSFQPAKLWALRRTIFGHGLVQILTTSLVLSLPPLLVGFEWKASLVIGMGLGLSSTALVMQTLDDAGLRDSPFGERTVAVLLFEDLSIVPFLLIVALLAPVQDAQVPWSERFVALAAAGGAIIGLILAARYLLNPIFTVLARTGVQELMTAGALGVVIAAALLMDLVGLSYAMGAFIAGVMLASSKFRHEVEANIEPFRGLLLGLFFIAVGLSLDLSVVVENWLTIILAVPLLMLVKGLTVYAVNRFFQPNPEDATRMAFALAQHGEFGFVLFAAAVGVAVLDQQTGSLLVCIVTLSMAGASLLDTVLSRRKPAARILDENFDGAHGEVLLIGFGRFGQLVSQPLNEAGLQLRILDNDADRVEEARSFGARVHFGNGMRRDVLRAAGAASARCVIICIDKPDQTDAIVALIRRDFPHLRIFVRAFDRLHVIGLGQVDGVVRETAPAALHLADLALKAMGFDDTEAAQNVRIAATKDEARLHQQIQDAPEDATRAALVASIKPKALFERAKR
ncbi:monovalent cation:proton antiporter-2 (CPA2) family protein [Litoreibacter roseus]|uniref:Potassium efflux system protein n=1 Tax=Litoreibacter roseus TaxID=2601869 RepID=A0A6N6JNS5_9RHOB|nr:monovalent cation:proton antiporter-2 (CPA2) family protein [Litoreibacter roseus]GFE67042.1 potassium efflux system protein [Litoreibacter roseus]